MESSSSDENQSDVETTTPTTEQWSGCKFIQIKKIHL